MDSTYGEPYEYQPELDAYLRALDRVLPDAVEGVCLTGSTALGDYRHGQSDLDLLTLTTRPLTIATGEIISKSRAAEYSAELFPAYADVLARVRASRAGDESVTYTTRDGLALCDLVDEICDSAAKLA